MSGIPLQQENSKAMELRKIYTRIILRTSTLLFLEISIYTARRKKEAFEIYSACMDHPLSLDRKRALLPVGIIGALMAIVPFRNSTHANTFRF